MEIAYTHIGVRVITRLRELGLKQIDLCRETGLSTTAISQYCTGKRVPDTVALHKMAIVLKTSMEWILTGEDATIEDFAIKEPRFQIYCDGVPLNDEEADLVAMYRFLDERGQEDVLDFVTMKYERATGERGSIYSTYTDEEKGRKKGPGDSGTSSGIA